jgi:hypothetical protein
MHTAQSDLSIICWLSLSVAVAVAVAVARGKYLCHGCGFVDRGINAYHDALLHQPERPMAMENRLNIKRQLFCLSSQVFS